MTFKYLDYRKNLKDYIKRPEVKTRVGGVVKVAEACGMHGPYLSGALNERIHLNQDQLYELCSVLGIENEEEEFLVLCLEYTRSVSQSRRKLLKEKLNFIRRGLNKVEDKLLAKKADTEDMIFIEYYSDPYYKIIHSIIQLPHFSRNPEKIGKALKLSEDTLYFYVQKLVEFGFIVKKKGYYKVLKKNYHLPKSSFICKPHQFSMKSLSLSKLNDLNDHRKESVSVTFSGDEDLFNAIQAGFLDFLKKTESLVTKNSKNEDIYQLNFDLFPWT